MMSALLNLKRSGRRVPDRYSCLQVLIDKMAISDCKEVSHEVGPEDEGDQSEIEIQEVHKPTPATIVVSSTEDEATEDEIDIDQLMRSMFAPPAPVALKPVVDPAGTASGAQPSSGVGAAEMDSLVAQAASATAPLPSEYRTIFAKGKAQDEAKKKKKGQANKTDSKRDNSTPMKKRKRRKQRKGVEGEKMNKKRKKKKSKKTKKRTNNTDDDAATPPQRKRIRQKSTDCTDDAAPTSTELRAGIEDIISQWIPAPDTTRSTEICAGLEDIISKWVPVPDATRLSIVRHRVYSCAYGFVLNRCKAGVDVQQARLNAKSLAQVAVSQWKQRLA